MSSDELSTNWLSVECGSMRASLYEATTSPGYTKPVWCSMRRRFIADPPGRRDRRGHGIHHEISPIQLGSACVGKNRERIASDASRVTVCTRCMCSGRSVSTSLTGRYSRSLRI